MAEEPEYVDDCVHDQDRDPDDQEQEGVAHAVESGPRALTLGRYYHEGKLVPNDLQVAKGDHKELVDSEDWPGEQGDRQVVDVQKLDVERGFSDAK